MTRKIPWVSITKNDGTTAVIKRSKVDDLFHCGEGACAATFEAVEDLKNHYAIDNHEGVDIANDARVAALESEKATPPPAPAPPAPAPPAPAPPISTPPTPLRVRSEPPTKRRRAEEKEEEEGGQSSGSSGTVPARPRRPAQGNHARALSLFSLPSLQVARSPDLLLASRPQPAAVNPLQPVEEEDEMEVDGAGVSSSVIERVATAAAAAITQKMLHEIPQRHVYFSGRPSRVELSDMEKVSSTVWEKIRVLTGQARPPISIELCAALRHVLQSGPRLLLAVFSQEDCWPLLFQLPAKCDESILKAVVVLTPHAPIDAEASLLPIIATATVDPIPLRWTSDLVPAIQDMNTTLLAATFEEAGTDAFVGFIHDLAKSGGLRQVSVVDAHLATRSPSMQRFLAMANRLTGPGQLLKLVLHSSCLPVDSEMDMSRSLGLNPWKVHREYLGPPNGVSLRVTITDDLDEPFIVDMVQQLRQNCGEAGWRGVVAVGTLTEASQAAALLNAHLFTAAEDSTIEAWYSDGGEKVLVTEVSNLSAIHHPDLLWILLAAPPPNVGDLAFAMSRIKRDSRSQLILLVEDRDVDSMEKTMRTLVKTDGCKTMVLTQGLNGGAGTECLLLPSCNLCDYCTKIHGSMGDEAPLLATTSTALALPSHHPQQQQQQQRHLQQRALREQRAQERALQEQQQQQRQQRQRAQPQPQQQRQRPQPQGGLTEQAIRTWFPTWAGINALLSRLSRGCIVCYLHGVAEPQVHTLDACPSLPDPSQGHLAFSRVSLLKDENRRIGNQLNQYVSCYECGSPADLCRRSQAPPAVRRDTPCTYPFVYYPALVYIIDLRRHELVEFLEPGLRASTDDDFMTWCSRAWEKNPQGKPSELPSDTVVPYKGDKINSSRTHLGFLLVLWAIMGEGERRRRAA